MIGVTQHRECIITLVRLQAGTCDVTTSDFQNMLLLVDAVLSRVCCYQILFAKQFST